jgi:hypothetical protein
MIDAVNPTEVKSASRKSLDVFEIWIDIDC